MATITHSKFENKYTPFIESENVLENKVNIAERHHKILSETNEIIFEITNSVFDKSQKDIALKLAQDKGRELIPKIKDLAGY